MCGLDPCQGAIQIQHRRRAGETFSAQIAALEAKIRREKQPKKRFELVHQLRVLQTLM